MVASVEPECAGLAPLATLHTHKVFSSKKHSLSRWFNPAFDAILADHRTRNGTTIVNLSIGGPDYLDEEFVGGIRRLTGAGVIVVSAAGNDGPLFGTQNNPADETDVISVGGIGFDGDVARFSSRGMTTHNVATGSGRVKPDIVTVGRSVLGSRVFGGCRYMSGTSVASPVAAGAIALLLSALPPQLRQRASNPATVKQALHAGAVRLHDPATGLYVQGAGRLNLHRSLAHLLTVGPTATAFPPALNLTDCPFTWPHCAQPLVHPSTPLLLNLTLLNGQQVDGTIVGQPTFRPLNEAAERLAVAFSFSRRLFPWSGSLGVSVALTTAVTTAADASGIIDIVVDEQLVSVPLTLRVAPAPPRRRRLLLDLFHSIRYPTAYLPRDDLRAKATPFDWLGDSPATNFRRLSRSLHRRGYHLDVATAPLTCTEIPLEEYAAVITLDAEDDWYPAEVELLSSMRARGVGPALVVVGDWHDRAVMDRLAFYDDNSASWWTPATGGANTPALNDLLAHTGIAFGDGVFGGDFSMDVAPLASGSPVARSAYFSSGSAIARAPAGAFLLHANLVDESAAVLAAPASGVAQAVAAARGRTKVAVGALIPGGGAGRGGGVAVLGDSTCLDDTSLDEQCIWLLLSALTVVAGGEDAAAVFPAAVRLTEPWSSVRHKEPTRPTVDADAHTASRLADHSLLQRPGGPDAWCRPVGDTWLPAPAPDVPPPAPTASSAELDALAALALDAAVAAWAAEGLSTPQPVRLAAVPDGPEDTHVHGVLSPATLLAPHVTAALAALYLVRSASTSTSARASSRRYGSGSFMV